MFVETSDEIENQNLPSVGQDVLLEFALNKTHKLWWAFGVNIEKAQRKASFRSRF